VEEISNKFGMSESDVVFAMGSTHMPISIYAQSDYKDEKSQLLLDKISVEDKQEDIIDMLQLRTAISGLNDRDKRVIILRYFRDMTQSEVASMMGVSQVQVSRIENRVMATFRKQLTG
jgi:RNA polymerase sporulation-specific sigma factor